jgi:RNA-directed DNA polymerase
MRIIARKDKLRYAWSKINKKNAKSAGVDGLSIADFKLDAENHLRKISKKLRDGTYEFRGARGTLIPKSDQGKRPLKIATVGDRVVTKAIALHLKPKLSKFDQPCSFAYRSGLGTHNAITEIHRLAKTGLEWVLEADIQSFFDNVDRNLLLTKLSTIIKSKENLDFIRRALTSEVENIQLIDKDLRGLFRSAGEGIPQGNILSPLFANFYLHSFDKAMMRKGYGLVRYADDFVVMCRTQQEAVSAYKYAYQLLHDDLKLDMHPISNSGKTTIRRYKDGFNFLGFFIHDEKPLVSSKSKIKFKKRIKEILQSEADQTLLKKVQRLNYVARGWYEAFKIADLESFPREADDFLYTEFSQFLRKKKLFRSGDTLGWRQMKFVGVVSLGDCVRTKSDTAANPKHNGQKRSHRPNRQKRTVPAVSPPTEGSVVQI